MRKDIRMSKAIGIDLGTTNSCVAVVEGGKPVIIPNKTGNRTTPSVVAFTASGDRPVGEVARRQAAVNSAYTVSSVKRNMGSDWHIDVEGRSYKAQEISAMILRQLKSDAEDYLGTEVKDAVITVPAYFNDIQRQATKDAGRIAGLNVLRIINEPTSAALAYGLDNGGAKKIMVFDLGGGTFDVSVIEIADGVIEVLATGGDNHLGGDDFDARVTEQLLQEIRRRYSLDLRKDTAALQRVKEAAEQAKKELSSMESATISLPYLAQTGKGPVHFEYTLTRSDFNSWTKDLVERTAEPVRNALIDAGIAASELDKVLLVGGSTRIPAVQAKVYELTGIAPSRNINPDECVAMGAAIQADTLSGGGIRLAGTETGILLLDVTPLSLSIETVGGVATRLVERNSTLPIHYSQIFSTAASFQSSVEIHVLQGERPMAKDNKTIGKFKLNGIQRAPAGVPQIEVTFDIDTNGILKVSARDLKTGKAQSVTITANGKMSDEEIEEAIRDAERHSSQDDARRSAVEQLNEVGNLMSRVENALNTSGKQLPKEERKQIKTDLIELRKKTARMRPDTITEAEQNEIRILTEKLRSDASALL